MSHFIGLRFTYGLAAALLLIGALVAAIALHGIGFVAINANDARTYPDDSFDNMKVFAARETGVSDRASISGESDSVAGASVERPSPA